MPHGLRLSQVVESYMVAAYARRLSPATLADYGNTYRKLAAFTADADFASITPDLLRSFLAAQTHLSGKSLLNYHVGLSALWHWAADEGIVESNIVRTLPEPKAIQRAIIPFEREDVRRLLAAADVSRPYAKGSKPQVTNTLPLGVRNRAMILVFLDTGMRASELSGLHLGDVDLRALRVTVMGKGQKQRTLPISNSTAVAMRRYLAVRPSDGREPWFFLSQRSGHLDRAEVGHIIAAIGERAGVPANPHRFRHTFAITFLRNGGNVYVLQTLLGHTSLDMVRRYLHIVESDIESAHQQASPVANWRL